MAEFLLICVNELVNFSISVIRNLRFELSTLSRTISILISNNLKK